MQGGGEQICKILPHLSKTGGYNFIELSTRHNVLYNISANGIANWFYVRLFGINILVQRQNHPPIW